MKFVKSLDIFKMILDELDFIFKFINTFAIWTRSLKLLLNMKDRKKL